MFLSHTSQGDQAPNIKFAICNSKGVSQAHMYRVQSATITIDVENPSTLEVEVVNTPAIFSLSKCDGAFLIRVEYKSFEWYFTPRTFELKSSKLNPDIAKITGVDAMGAFETQIAYPGYNATVISKKFAQVFTSQKKMPKTFLGGKKFVTKAVGNSDTKVQFETKAMQWRDVMDIFTERAGLRFTVETSKTKTGLSNTLYYFEPGQYADVTDPPLSNYAPVWVFEHGDIIEYELKSFAPAGNVLMMYDDAEDVNDAKTWVDTGDAKSEFAIREAIMHTPKEMFANIVTDPDSSPHVGYLKRNAWGRSELTVTLSADVASNIENTPHGDNLKVDGYTGSGSWCPGMMARVMIGGESQWQEIVRAEITLQGGRVDVTPTLVTPGSGARDFYTRLNEMNSSIRRISQRGY